MKDNELIVCRDVSLGYEGKSVLTDLDLTIAKGDYLCVVGDNGSGKSTLMRGLLGLIQITAVSGGGIIGKRLATLLQMIVYKHARCTAGFRKHALTFPHLHIPNPQRQNSTAQQNADCNHRGPFHFCLHKAVPFLPSPSAAPAGCMFCINTVLISPFMPVLPAYFVRCLLRSFHWIPPLSPAAAPRPPAAIPRECCPAHAASGGSVHWPQH